jgi:hypothetical protein
MVHPARDAMSGGIDRVRARTPPATAGRANAQARDDGAFAAMLAPDEAANGSAEAAATAGLAGGAWLQASVADVFARTAQDRRARRHGRALLQALAGVQRAALAGDGDRGQAALAALACTAMDEHEADDPVLRLILREIAVRAAVELARGERPAPGCVPP